MTSPLVFKIGGEALLEPDLIDQFLHTVKKLQTQRQVVIVHGGGPQVEELMALTALKSTKIDGVRSTPYEHLPIVTGALAGVASQQLLAACKRCQINAVALSLADSDLTIAQIKSPKLGAVGDVFANSAHTLKVLLDSGHLVALNSIGCSNRGQTLNINADDAAVAITHLLGGELYLLSNVEGVLDQNGKLIPQLDAEKIDYLIKEGVITDGMVVKVNAAYLAAKRLRRPVNIGSWRDQHALKSLYKPNAKLGTQIQT